MKATYRIAVKQLCRERLRDFIRERFSAAKLATAKVLCFPGREALEISQIYQPLGIPLQNIVCLEARRTVYNELNRRHLGVQLRNQTLAQFIESAPERGFDIISLDFTGQLGTYENQLYRLSTRGFFADSTIVFTNFSGAREADTSKGYYHLAQQRSEHALDMSDMIAIVDRWRQARYSEPALQRILQEYESRPLQPFWEGSLAQQRHSGIHHTVRTVVTNGTPPCLIDLLFEERNQDGSLDAGIEEFFDLNRSLPDDESPAFAAAIRRVRQAARKKDDVLPTPLLIELGLEIKTRLRQLVRQIARRSPLLRLDIENTVKLLEAALDTFLTEPSVVLATQSYKYVSDKGTPMYADLFHVQRVVEFRFLSSLLSRDARSMGDLLAPLRRLSLKEFAALLRQISERGSRLSAMEKATAATPERIELGRESQLNPRQPSPELSPQAKKLGALTLLTQSPQLTNEDIALALQVKPMQVAAWKAHLTLGTYSPSSRGALEALMDQAFNAGRYGEALALSKRLLKRNRRSIRLLNDRSVILQCLGRSMEALRTIDRALAVDSKNPRLLGTKAKILEECERPAEAVELFEHALSVAPGHPELHVGFADLLRSQGRYDESIIQYDHALSLNPQLFSAQCGKACVPVDRGTLTEALPQLDVLVSQHPNQSAAFYNRAVALARVGRSEDAITDLQQALVLNSNDANAAYNLGCCLLECGRNEDASSAFARAVQLDPTHVSALNNLGIALARLDQHERAIEAFSQALRLQPDACMVLDNRAEALRKWGRTQEALADCSRLVKLQPTCLDYRDRRAALLIKLRHFDAALEELDRTLANDPNHRKALLGKAAVCSELGNHHAALSALERVVAADPRDVVALLACAVAQLDTGATKAALRTLNKALQLEPNNIRALNDKGMTLAQLGRLDAALKCFERAIQVEPTHHDALYNKASMLATIGDFARAISAFDDCLAVHPEDQQALCNRATSKLSHGDVPGAEEDFLATLQLDPGDRIALEKLRRIDALKLAVQAQATACHPPT